MKCYIKLKVMNIKLFYKLAIKLFDETDLRVSFMSLMDH